MIELDSLTFNYPDSPTIFRDFCWRVETGETWAVLGPSGCGKTTLLYLLAGLRLPSSGQVRIDGYPLLRPRPHTGLILQDYGLLPWATVSENATLGLKVRAFYGPDDKHAPRDFRPLLDVEPWLDRLGLTPIKDKYPVQISGGQRQRCAIARTLALSPDLLLMDEPFSSLDANTRSSLQKLTLELWAEQSLTLVTITHSIEEAVVLGQKILLLGEPPNHEAQVINNPQGADLAFCDTPGYSALVRDLRQKLGEIA
jgi:ABC-type nitrate/sulfonate/bicarbonate transport system ATPase subunit